MADVKASRQVFKGTGTLPEGVGITAVQVDQINLADMVVHGVAGQDIAFQYTLKAITVLPNSLISRPTFKTGSFYWDDSTGTWAQNGPDFQRIQPQGATQTGEMELFPLPGGSNVFPGIPVRIYQVPVGTGGRYYYRVDIVSTYAPEQ